MSFQKEELIEQLSNLTVLQIAELVSDLEEKWGVSAQAAVAVAAAPGAGGGGEAAAEDKKTDVKVVVDIALQYNDSYNDQIYAYANSIHNIEGGTHLSGFRTALTRSINNYAKANNLIKDKDPNITTEAGHFSPSPRHSWSGCGGKYGGTINIS